MQTRGVVPYLILEDNSAWNGYDHERYFRKMIARFGYLPAVVFNLGEEHNENYPLAEGLELAKQFKGLDPFGHPLGIHNVNRPHNDYVDSPHLDFTAIQTGRPGRPSAVRFAVEHNRIANDWMQRCLARHRRVLVVNFDEGRPELDRRAWWSAYIGSGVWEAHVLAPYDQPHSTWERTWRELGEARSFMESLPFHEMTPRNELVTAGQAFCLAKPGEVYALYLPQGGTASVRNYRYAWWDPASGRNGAFQRESSTRRGQVSFAAPAAGDWALRIVSSDKRREGTP